MKRLTVLICLWLFTVNAALSAALATQPEPWTVSLAQAVTPTLPRATMPAVIVTTPQPYALRYTLYSTGRESAIIQSYVSNGYTYVRHAAKTEPQSDGTVRISVEFVLRRVRE